MGVETAPPLLADGAEIARFVDALFRHATPGTIVSLRAFSEGGDRASRIELARVTEAPDTLVAAATRLATEAAQAPGPAVFAPPVATFAHAEGVEAWRARAEDLAEGLALSVELDAAPARARIRLEHLLGAATVAVASGGFWTDLGTGEVEDRLHLHWRLTEPTRAPDRHARLREARRLATAIAGGDASNIPVVHPIRWPGSWHRKAAPRLARIVALNREAELDLDEALERLQEAAAATGSDPAPATAAPGGLHPVAPGFGLRADDPLDVCAALAAIPNPDLAWDEWNRIGMATWAATAGSATGCAAFMAWSARSAKDDPATTAARWAHYAGSPPDRIGAGTLFHRAAEARPGWRRPSLAARKAGPAEVRAAEVPAAEDPAAGPAAAGDATVDEMAPVDLWSGFAPPDLPGGLLPPVIEDWAVAQSELMGSDAGGLAMAGLAVAAAALPDRIAVQVKVHDPGWREPARIWVALVGDPSTKKSPTLSAAARPLVRIDAELFRTFAAAHAAHERLSPEEKRAALRPKHYRKRLEDTTIEAMQEVLKDSPDGLLVLQDELSGWFGSMDKYAGNRGAARDRAFWLQGFNGGEYALSRITRGSALLPNLSVCVLGGIQPEPVRRLVGEAVDDGLIQRLFPIVLRPARLGRDAPPPAGVLDAYERAVEGLFRMRPPPPSGLTIGSVETAPLRFDDGAQAIRRDLEAHHLRLVSCEAVNRKLAAHLGKYDGLFARLSVLFHCLDHWREASPPPVIPAATAERVARFMSRFLMPHAAAFYGTVLGLSDDHDRLTAVAGYILAHGLSEVTCRVVERSVRQMRGLDRPDVLRVLHQLEVLGWLDPVPLAKPGAAPRWVVNPAVHRLYADRAEAEVARREAAREAIRSLAGRSSGG